MRTYNKQKPRTCTPRNFVATVLMFSACSLFATDTMTVEVKEGYAAFRQRNYDLAISKLTGPAERGDGAAQYYLGSALLAKLDGGRSDRTMARNYMSASQRPCIDPALGKKAEEMFEKSARSGNLDASFKLISLYKNGACGISASESLFKLWSQRTEERLLKAAKSGESDAQYRLGRAYLEKEFDSQDRDTEAAEWLSRAVGQGNTNAMYFLSECYRTGRGVKKDLGRVLELMHRMAMAIKGPGAGHAEFYLARAYAFGIGTNKDIPKALEWYRHVLAKHPANRIRELDEILAQDVSAGGWSARSALERGKGEELFREALAYQRGIGRPINISKAVSLYERASAQGHAQAQFNLAVLLQLGRGVRRDEPKSVEYYLKAAVNGHRDAQFNVAQMYEFGRGVPVDHVESSRWYRLAAHQGHLDATKKVVSLDRTHGKPELHVIYRYKGGQSRRDLPKECGEPVSQPIGKFSKVTVHNPARMHTSGGIISRTVPGTLHGIPGDKRAEKPANINEQNWVTIDVLVKRKGRPLIIALGAYESVHWNLKIDPQVNLSQLIIGGYHPQKITGIPEGAKLLRRVLQENPGASDNYLDLSLSKYRHPHREGTDYDRTVTRLRLLTGLEPTSSQSEGPIGPREISGNVVYPWFSNSSSAELHVIQVADGLVWQSDAGNPCPPRGKVDVSVYPASKPVVLVLLSKKPVRWHVQQNRGAKVIKVLVNDTHPQVSGLAPTVSVIGTWEIDGSITGRGDPDSKILEQIKQISGLDVNSTQISDQQYSFTVPMASKNETSR